MKALKLKKASIFTKIVIIGLTLYAIVSLVGVRGRVAEAESLREELQQQVTEITQQNAELEYQIDHGTDEEIIEEIARNKLGLVLPGEKVFYDISD
ncbi:MAG: septum formation initiator family protein [Clostridia bacterium]|nr:septum formation initiator family protein [Clostridia bacterium]